MSLFKSRLATLSMRSDVAIGVFTKTVDDLTSINKEIVDEQDKKKVEVSVLTQEIEALDEIETTNKNLINKIKSFLW